MAMFLVVVALISIKVTALKVSKYGIFSGILSEYRKIRTRKSSFSRSEYYNVEKSITPFHTTCLFVYLLKTSENVCFFDVFKGYRKRPAAWNGLTMIQSIKRHKEKRLPRNTCTQMQSFLVGTTETILKEVEHLVKYKSGCLNVYTGTNDLSKC